VEQATSGQLRIDVHPNNTLFKLNDIRQAVQDGKVQAGETIMTSMVKDIPIAGADAIPSWWAAMKMPAACGSCSARADRAALCGARPQGAVRRALAAPGPVRRPIRAFICGLQGH
jgi:hypothetical protein